MNAARHLAVHPRRLIPLQARLGHLLRLGRDNQEGEATGVWCKRTK